jgi:hypothetical protein
MSFMAVPQTCHHQKAVGLSHGTYQKTLQKQPCLTYNLEGWWSSSPLDVSLLYMSLTRCAKPPPRTLGNSLDIWRQNISSNHNQAAQSTSDSGRRTWLNACSRLTGLISTILFLGRLFTSRACCLSPEETYVVHLAHLSPLISPGPGISRKSSNANSPQSESTISASYDQKPRSSTNSCLTDGKFSDAIQSLCPILSSLTPTNLSSVKWTSFCLSKNFPRTRSATAAASRNRLQATSAPRYEHTRKYSRIVAFFNKTARVS